jgi:hypothetical protein
MTPTRIRCGRILPWLLAVTTLAGLACRPSRGGRAETGILAISHAVVPVPSSRAEATAFMVVENRGSTLLTLVGATSPDADSVVLHRDIGGQMQPVASLDLPAGSRQTFAPGRLHLMLEGLHRPLTDRDTVTLQLRFAPTGDILVRAPVLRYTEAISEVP